MSPCVHENKRQLDLDASFGQSLIHSINQSINQSDIRCRRRPVHSLGRFLFRSAVVQRVSESGDPSRELSWPVLAMTRLPLMDTGDTTRSGERRRQRGIILHIFRTVTPQAPPNGYFSLSDLLLERSSKQNIPS